MNERSDSDGEARAGGVLGGILAPLGQPRLMREQAFDRVKQAIINGELQPGVRLTERELCGSLGVSRTVVREMLRRLEAERLIEVTAHRGPRVTELTRKTAREIYDLRVALEVLLVRDFVARAEDADMAHLRAVSHEIDTMLSAPDPHRFAEIMDRYYAHLMAVAGNATAADILNMLYARISMLRFKAMEEPGRIAASVGEIQRMIDRLLARDPDGAEAATRAYVLAARDAALRQIDTKAPAEPPGPEPAARRGTI